MNKKILISSLILILILMVFATPVFANNLSIERSGLEFEIVPQDQELINISNMSPGDTITSQLVITNNYENEIELYFRAERLDEEPEVAEPDLYKQILMEVKLDGDIIDFGPMNNIATGSGILLGVFQPNESQVMEVTATLPGATTGNEFMNLEHSNRWIFTAGGEEIVIIEEEEIPIGPGKLPKTGEVSSGLFLLIGAIVVTTGLVLKKKNE